ncbi:Protein ST7 homolog [Eumeta japonica]|uniref:Protein ST7 homolog n=1 Tax=Eumeta variegata TaxID=151549 RepID=A0A4C1XKC6_EUMVA|nr:Protein ST7 homolog [Eumeta japonica]
MWDTSVFLTTLTPKFYVALTGTSSLISGLILIFEWWYFRKYGTSFIEQVSLSHLSPWLGGGTVSGAEAEAAAAAAAPGPQPAPECKVWRNPLNLLRGAEYQRFYWATGKEPLTYYDMNLSAQEHQTLFTCESDAGRPEHEAMARAWRERSPAARVAAARRALAARPDCAPAMLLLAEEDAPTVEEAERALRAALRAAEAAARASAVALSSGGPAEAARRDAAVLAHVRRRLAMCARRLGRLREAARLFRELARDAPPALLPLATHENLIEVLLAQRAYADVQAVLARYDDISLPKSACICYTAALLRARAAAERAPPDAWWRREGSPGATLPPASALELAAVEAIHRAVEFNPHVPEYLLELRPLALPPEHVLKRGDSEAVAYAFFHLQHWKAADGALRLLAATWRGAFRALPAPLERGHLFYPYPACTECADRELLAAHHALSVYPERRAPPALALAAALCALTAALALATHRWPEAAAAAAAAAVRTAHAHLHPARLLALLSDV